MTATTSIYKFHNHLKTLYVKGKRMKICFNELLAAVSYTLDYAEQELLGVTTHHSERVAYLCAKMGHKIDLSSESLSDLVACALLHDNAITEYVYSEHTHSEYMEIAPQKIEKEKFLRTHCIMGEENMKEFPFHKNREGVILYHHENVDGSGPLGKKDGEIPFFAELIHLADRIDVAFDIREMSQKKYLDILEYIKNNKKILFGEDVVELFGNAVGYEDMVGLSSQNISTLIQKEISYTMEEYTPDELVSIGKVFARIVDYKSSFTSYHSLGVAEKAYQMGEYYGYSEEEKAKLFLAGALHDLGKIVIENSVLEKPGKLTEEEMEQMQNHVKVTYDVLSNIRGFEEITLWSSLHHEKLNGTGYPFGYRAEELGFHERLMACIDIYQALAEDRPYKDVMSHEKIMKILFYMADEKALDRNIVADLDKVFASKDTETN